MITVEEIASDPLRCFAEDDHCVDLEHVTTAAFDPSTNELTIGFRMSMAPDTAERFLAALKRYRESTPGRT